MVSQPLLRTDRRLRGLKISRILSAAEAAERRADRGLHKPGNKQVFMGVSFEFLQGSALMREQRSKTRVQRSFATNFAGRLAAHLKEQGFFFGLYSGAEKPGVTMTQTMKHLS